MRVRIYGIIAAIVMLLCGMNLTVCAGTDSENLAVLGVLPESVAAAEDNKAVSRGEFAYMAAQLTGCGELASETSLFSDVSSNNVYSGYINYLARLGVVKGNENGEFLPDDPIYTEDAYKIVINALGFSIYANQNGEENYFKAAYNLGFLNGVANGGDGILRKKSAVRLMKNIIFSELPSATYQKKNEQTQTNYSNEQSRVLLAETFGISVYEGVISNVNLADNSADFTVVKNKYDTNPDILTPGNKIKLKGGNKTNLYEYENLSVSVWVRNENELVSINLIEDVEIRYTGILSVNGNSDRTAKYSADGINRITIADDEKEYKLTDNARIMLNRKTVTGTVNLSGRFAKIVISDGDVECIETWDLKEGGIITSVNESNIQYIFGENAKVNLGKFDECNEKLFFIGGRIASLKEIKKNSLFYYYMEEDYVVIAVSEKIITDKFMGVSDDGVNIGDIEYDARNVYFSDDGENYKLNKNSEKLFGKTIDAYAAPNGDILYIKPSDGNAADNEFIGILYGTSSENGISDETDVAMWRLGGEKPQKVTYKITAKTKYEDGITLDELKANIKNYDGKGVYKFKINSSEKITKVSKLKPFYGYNSDSVKVSVSGTFMDVYSPAFVYYNSRRLYYDNVKVTVLYEYDGEFTVKQVMWQDLYSRNIGPKGVTMEFFGEEKESVPNFIILTGDIEPIGNISIKPGFVTGRKQVMDENGNNAVMLDIYYRGEKRQEIVSEKIASKIPEKALIEYNDGLQFSDNGIYLHSVTDLSGNWQSWDMPHGTVEKYDGKRVYFTDGTALFTNNPRIISYNSNRKMPFEFKKSQYDVLPGATLYYVDDKDGITDMIYIEE